MPCAAGKQAAAPQNDGPAPLTRSRRRSARASGSLAPARGWLRSPHRKGVESPGRWPGYRTQRTGSPRAFAYGVTRCARPIEIKKSQPSDYGRRLRKTGAVSRPRWSRQATPLAAAPKRHHGPHFASQAHSRPRPPPFCRQIGGGGAINGQPGRSPQGRVERAGRPQDGPGAIYLALSRWRGLPRQRLRASAPWAWVNRRGAGVVKARSAVIPPFAGRHGPETGARSCYPAKNRPR